MDTPYDIIRLPEIGSTQDRAIDEARHRGRDMLVVADRQVTGRGRQGREWIEPDHGLYSSYAFVNPWPTESAALLALCTAVAVRRAVRDVLELAVECKWPNDIVFAGRKVGGILPDAVDGWVTIGCGLNLAWSEPPEFASALLDAPPGPATAPALAIAWVDHLRAIISDGPEAWPRSTYKQACTTLGKRVRWDGGEGTAVDIAADGHLIVDTTSGTTTVIGGDVHLLGHN